MTYSHVTLVKKHPNDGAWVLTE